MRSVLHIFDSQEAPFDAEVVREETKLADCSVMLFDLNEKKPDYDALLNKIFSADCVEVW